MSDQKQGKNIPEIKGTLRKHVVEVPKVIRECSGIKIFGKRIKSLLFSTDVAIIKNTNADAVIAVYPFTPQPLITQALVMAADIPVFCGVGGGITQGKRVVNLALDAEFKGAMGVVVNAPTSNEIIKHIRETIDIPVIVTVIAEDEDISKRIESGATIINVSGGKNTAKIVRNIKKMYPDFPVIATGGPCEETIKETIEAGANAITFTPPTSASIMGELMDEYRKR
ncbi:hydrolase [Clostridium butyricum]|uniref:Hydrolase n=1 Tax=Clostridium butyricum TaxID=1492 RepID=A0A2S7FE41_CLOBU|nr:MULTISPECIES: dihydrodipicolinate synthase/N-acetylneuraminate lyase [Clostridium]ETI88875.1 MAG: Dihydrodipicolinate synthase/N-acetylneuraminate lyase [Clostridium butyricum DORA_1]KHD15528.1 hydrolase [Clostridium butyricum]MBS5984256.1 hydrolase [Clostridium butyricum]MBZ0313029.1 hydrolase [Clostridium butyricum]MDB2151831.1 hydrolase [Clostridium butyricum]